MKDCAFSLQNNKIIYILRKEFQENKKPIRQWCGLVKCGGGNRARSTAIATKVNRVQCGLSHRAHASARCGTHLRAVITTQTKEKPYYLVGFRGVGGALVT